MDGPRSMALSVNAVERALIKLQATPDAYFALFAACRILPLKARRPPRGPKFCSRAETQPPSQICSEISKVLLQPC